MGWDDQCRAWWPGEVEGGTDGLLDKEIPAKWEEGEDEGRNGEG